MTLCFTKTQHHSLLKKKFLPQNCVKQQSETGRGRITTKKKTKANPTKPRNQPEKQTPNKQKQTKRQTKWENLLENQI